MGNIVDFLRQHAQWFASGRNMTDGFVVRISVDGDTIRGTMERGLVSGIDNKWTVHVEDVDATALSGTYSSGLILQDKVTMTLENPDTDPTLTIIFSHRNNAPDYYPDILILELDE